MNEALWRGFAVAFSLFRVSNRMEMYFCMNNCVIAFLFEFV